MREARVARFVRATPAIVERALTPAAVVEYEGSFDVRDVTETDDVTLVTAGARGLELQYAFEAREDGLHYVQREGGPLDTLETTLTYTAENEGTRVTMTSTVGAGLPLPALTDRAAAWKRRGELRRALSRLAEDVA
jgi:homoserine dehydrogenase